MRQVTGRDGAAKATVRGACGKCRVDLIRIAAVAGVFCAQFLAVAGAMAQESTATIQGEMPEDVREAIVRAVGESRRPPASRLEARRRAADAAADVQNVLESLGYYGHIIQPDVGDDNRPVVKVQTGPVYKYLQPNIAWQGEAPPPEVEEAAEYALGLKEGDPHRTAELYAAQGRIVSALQQLGYADAKSDIPQTIIDHAITASIPDFPVTSGSLVILDGLKISTNGRTDEAWVRRLAPWEGGDLYNPESVAELERRLLDAQVFDSVTVSLSPATETVEGRRPVIVNLSERARRLQEVSGGYSTDEGIGADIRYTYYNRLGRADTMSALLRLAEIEQRLEGQLSLPHWRRPQLTLTLNSGVYQELTDAYDEIGAIAKADLTYRYSRTSYRTFGVSIDATQTDERVPVVRERNLISLAGLASISWDKSNDPLNPSKGWRVLASGEPIVSFGDDSATYLRMQAQGSYYLPLGSPRTVIASRLKLGSVAGGSLAQIPASRRLYAGGGGSVRGYSYQGVGPRLPDNTPAGGLGLVEASVEARHWFTEKWGGVAFIDVGGLSTRSTPDFSNVSTGVGFGVRYNLGFGPVRADIAVPLTKRDGDPSYQLYLSIGQSF